MAWFDDGEESRELVPGQWRRWALGEPVDLARRPNMWTPLLQGMGIILLAAIGVIAGFISGGSALEGFESLLALAFLMVVGAAWMVVGVLAGGYRRMEKAAKTILPMPVWNDGDPVDCLRGPDLDWDCPEKFGRDKSEGLYRQAEVLHWLSQAMVLGVFAGAGMALFYRGGGFGVGACVLAVAAMVFGAWGRSSRRAARAADVERWNFKAALAWSELAESKQWKKCLDEYSIQGGNKKKSKPRAKK